MQILYALILPFAPKADIFQSAKRKHHVLSQTFRFASLRMMQKQGGGGGVGGVAVDGMTA